MTVSLVKRPPVSLVKRPTLLRYATRATITQAERHFTYGGSVLVSTCGMDTVTVGPDSTTHNRDSVAWSDLRAQVTMWRNRYPRQRYYVLLHCGASQHHSEDRTVVFAGDAAHPLLLCGMHAQVLSDGTPEAAARAIERFRSLSSVTPVQPAEALFRRYGTDYPEGTTVNSSKATESVRTVERMERMTSSADGNPRFRFHFSDGSSAPTKINSMFALSLTDGIVGARVLVKIDGRGSIWDIEPVAS